LVRPLHIAVSAPEVVTVAPPGVAVTWYERIALPPLLGGAAHVTVACVSPAVATTEPGASGTVAGITAFDGADAAPVPAAFAAVTVNVYAVPFDRPLTTTEVAPAVLAVTPPGLERTV
jgi:hypothetical protein